MVTAGTARVPDELASRNRRKNGVPAAVERASVAPLPLMVRVLAAEPVSVRTDGRALPPSVASATAVNVYVPPAARLMVSGWLLVLLAVMAAISPPTSPLATLKTA